MAKPLSQLVKHSGIYGIGMILSRGIGFLMIPVTTRFLSPHDYGVLEMLDVLLFFAGIFAALGIHSAVFRFYSFYQTEEQKKAVISSALLAGGTIAALVSLLVMLFARPLAQALLGDPDSSGLVRLVAFTLFFWNLTEIPLAFWRAQERTVLYVLVILGRTVLGVGLLVVFLAVLQWGVRGALIANLLSHLPVGVLLFAQALRSVPRRIDGAILREMLRYGAPLVLQNLASFVLVFSDRFFLRHFGTMAELGVYALGYKLAAVVSLVVSVPFNMTWQWQQFELARRDDAKHLYAQIQTFWLLVSVSVGLLVAVLAKDVLRLLVPESYWAAAQVVPIIALCYVLADMRSVLLSGILVERATHRVALISVIVAAANLLLNYGLIARYRVMGAALATLLSYLLSLVLCYYISQRVYFVRYDYVGNALTLGTGSVIYLLSTLHHLTVAASLLVNLALLGVFGLLMFILMKPSERDRVRRLGHDLSQEWMR